MVAPAKRFSLLIVAFSVIAVALVACQSPTSPVANPASQNAVTGFHTPLPNNGQPTPAFPPFTMGAWPSIYSPANVQTITIYVLCRVQDQTMNGPAKPPPTPITITIVLNSPNGRIGGTYQGTTDADGLAAIPIALNDPYSGMPVTVVATGSYGGQTYTATTFFTPSPTAKPTPTPGTTATPGQPTPGPGTPTVTG